MARLVGMRGELPGSMLAGGQYAGAFFTRSGRVYERDSDTGLFQVRPRATAQGAAWASCEALGCGRVGWPGRPRHRKQAPAGARVADGACAGSGLVTGALGVTARSC
jgi:hypothetical protein